MNVIHRADFRRSDPYERISFNRAELSAILNVYGRMVAAGEWKDYLQKA